MKAVDIFVIVVSMMFGAALMYATTSMIHQISISAFRMGCANVGATFEVVQQCREMAEEKTKW